ncbi:NERD domain-containing protein [Sporolactobacillus sp. THM7-7]|nr:NERD domain-containing protein [Sporolactobacillus sp. THM7-7]
MIVKRAKPPYHLLQYESLFERLSPGPAKNRVEEKLKRYRAGFKGERSIDYFLSYLPEDRYLILHDLRLFDGKHYFQIDCLLLHPHFFLLLEVKNIAGTITFDPRNKQLIRDFNQKREAFEDPTNQGEILQDQLYEWLAVLVPNFPPVPITYRVVIASTRTLFLAIDPKNERVERFVRATYLKKEIEEVSKKYTKKYLSGSDLLFIFDLLIKHHQPRVVDLFRVENIAPDNIIKGVACPFCGEIPMRRCKKTWYCLSCRRTSKDAHRPALFRSYRCIYGPKITNKQCRDFLLLESRSSANHILHSLNLKYTGENRGRVYFLPDDQL